MAVTSTKDTSQSMKKTHDGKSGSENMPLATNATTHTPTLKEAAASLVALELDLKDIKAAGMLYKLVAYPSKIGKTALVVFIYHPKFPLGVLDLGDNNLVALIDGVKASEVATRKEEK